MIRVEARSERNEEHGDQEEGQAFLEIQNVVDGRTTRVRHGHAHDGHGEQARFVAQAVGHGESARNHRQGYGVVQIFGQSVTAQGEGETASGGEADRSTDADRGGEGEEQRAAMVFRIACRNGLKNQDRKERSDRIVTIPSQRRVFATASVGRTVRSIGTITVGPVTTTRAPNSSAMPGARPTTKCAAALTTPKVTSAPTVTRFRTTSSSPRISSRRSVSAPSNRIRQQRGDAGKEQIAEERIRIEDATDRSGKNAEQQQKRIAGRRVRQAIHWAATPATRIADRTSKGSGHVGSARECGEPTASSARTEVSSGPIGPALRRPGSTLAAAPSVACSGTKPCASRGAGPRHRAPPAQDHRAHRG